jgi:hypothetical protein
VSVDWKLLGQAAQATKDSELLALTQRCHPQTLRQMRWPMPCSRPSARRSSPADACDGDGGWTEVAETASWWALRGAEGVE